MLLGHAAGSVVRNMTSCPLEGALHGGSCQACSTVSYCVRHAAAWQHPPPALLLLLPAAPQPLTG